MADDTRDLQERRVIISEQREARFQRGSRRSLTKSATGVYRGNGMLAAMLLVGIALVAVRMVADFEVQEDGAIKGKVLHPQGQYGPIAILAGLLGSFFVLSFVAMGGGTRAKLAVILGGCIVLTLGVRSLGEIEKVGATFGSIGKITTPAPSGHLTDIFGNQGSTVPGATGLQGAASQAFANLPNAAPFTQPPSGWKTVPNGGGEVFAKNGKCPSGYTLAGDRCVPDLNTTGPPAS